MATTYVENLGAVEAEYIRNPRLVRTNQILSIIFIGLGLVGLAWAAWFAAVDLESGNYILCGGAGLAPLVLGLWAFGQWRREKEDRVTIHEKGLVYRRSRGSVTTVWDEITGLRMRIIHFHDLAKTTFNYILEKADGTELSVAFDNRVMADVADLGSTLEEKVNQKLLPRFTDEFNRDQPLVFGPIIVSKDHIHYGEKWVAWSALERVRVNNGRLTIYTGNREHIWVTLPIHEIPNISILLIFIGRFIGVERESLVEVTRARSTR